MRSTAFIFAFFYLLSSVGYGLEIHYCLGRISDINHALLETHCPCDSVHDAKESNNCCEERSFFNQLEEEYSAPQPVEEIGKFLPLTNVFEVAHLHTPKACDNCGYTIDSRGPPKVRDRVIEFHTLLVYG